MKQTAIQELSERNTFNVPEVPQIVENVPPVYIFNVSPNAFIENRGGLGDFVIQACPEGAKVSPATVIPGVVKEFYDNGTTTKGLALHEGINVARDVVGISSADRQCGVFTTNLEWHGVFISKTKEPSDKDIAAARAKRKERNLYVINEADGLYLKGPKGMEEIGIPHRLAAREENVKRPWSEKTVSQETCPACGSDVRPGIAVCPVCAVILNEELARKYFPERFAPAPKAEPVQQNLTPNKGR